jgi:hypothetical protein
VEPNGFIDRIAAAKIDLCYICHEPARQVPFEFAAATGFALCTLPDCIERSLEARGIHVTPAGKPPRHAETENLPVFWSEGQRREWDAAPTVAVLDAKDHATTAAWEAEAQGNLASEERPLTPAEEHWKEWLLAEAAAKPQPGAWRQDIDAALAPLPGVSRA